MASQISEESVELCNEKLLNLKLELLGNTYTLERIDAIDVIKLIKDDGHLNILGVALCIGSWTTKPAGQLRRHFPILTERFSAFPSNLALLKEQIYKAEICSREKPNRNGHNINITFPGITGWTQKYHDERLANLKKPKKAKTLENMKNYTQYAESFKEEAGLSENKIKLIDWVIYYISNPRDLERTKAYVQKIKDIPILDSPEFNTKVNDKIREISSVSKNHKKRPLHRFNQFLDLIKLS